MEFKEATQNYVDMVRPYVIEEIQKFKEVYDVDNFEMNKSIGMEIYDSIKALDESHTFPTADHIAKVAVATMNNIQVRDLLMGLHSEFRLNLVGTYLEILVATTVKSDSVALATVISQYYYIDNEIEQAKDLIKSILSEYPDYSLAKLLNRVFDGAMPPSGMAAMATELHHLVKAELFGADA